MPSGFWRSATARALFTANDGTHGSELWVTDGTAAGTGLVRDIRPGTGSSGPSGLVMLSQEDGSAIFTATDGVNGREIWVTDGTEAGTRLVRDNRRRIAGAGPASVR